MFHSPSGSSVHRILQARILEWVAILFSRGSSQPRHWTWVSHIAGRFFTVWATREASGTTVREPKGTTLRPLSESSLQNLLLSKLSPSQQRVQPSPQGSSQPLSILLDTSSSSSPTFANQACQLHLQKYFRDFPGGPLFKNLPANTVDTGSIPGLGRSHMPGGN